MIERWINKIKQRWCSLTHQSHQLKLPMYKQGTYEVVGTLVYCKKCIKRTSV